MGSSPQDSHALGQRPPWGRFLACMKGAKDVEGRFPRGRALHSAVGAMVLKKGLRSFQSHRQTRQ